MLFFVDVARIVGCYVSYAAASVDGLQAYNACVDDLRFYERTVCIYDYAISEGLALVAFADCLNF